MTARIFLTGASGYIGGEVLNQISRLSVKHHIRCLVRTSPTATAIQAAYPQVEIVRGNLDDTELIEKEAFDADVVLHLASTRHETSSRAIVRGLTNEKRTKQSYWLQIGGASLFAGNEIKAGSYGEAGSKIYDDVADIEEIKNVIKANPARIVDNLVLSQTSSKLRTALVPGPLIYGRGSGPGNTISMQGPTIANYTLKHGESFQVGQGKNVWSTIHITDIGRLFILLLEAAVDKREEGLWNENGFYLPENGKTAAKEQDLIQSEGIRSLSAEEANNVTAHGAVILGTNAQIHSSRANRFLKWQPTGRLLEEEVPEMVKYEATRMQKSS